MMDVKPVRWMMTGTGEPLVPMEFDIGHPGPDEVLVEIAGCGVCHTDLGYYYDGVRTNHPLPLCLGHEISGHVVEAGTDELWYTDRAVIIPAVIPCGRCDACQRGKGTICPNQKMPGNDIQGGFATHIIVPARGLCVVDEHKIAAAGIDLADLSVIADAVTTPYQAVVQAGVTKGDVCIVNGIGGVGGYCAQIATAMGGTTIAIDVREDKLAAIHAQGAAVLTLNAKELSPRDIKKAIQEFCKERGLRQREWVVFECSGTKVGQETAFSLLTHGGTLCLVGFTMDKVEVRLSNLMAFHARALGNWGCPPELYPEALDLVINGRIKVAPFVEKHPLSDINQVFEAVHAGTLKRRAVLVPNY